MYSKLIRLDSCGSTNTYLGEIAREKAHGTVVMTRSQTAGRGQRGNSWEAEPGKNLTFSLLLKLPQFRAIEQFAISEAVALGVADALRELLPSHDVTVKWANDIYVGDRKICGILIEHSLQGPFIQYSIAGIGINVNQRVFHSDAPNPVSLWQLTGVEYDLDSVLASVLAAIDRRLAMDRDDLHRSFVGSLWKSGGNTYRDAATGEVFHAAIADVKRDGCLVLIDGFGNVREYYFKEVAVMLTDE